ncbi:hypothetical protein EGI20_07825 [Aquitalea sp. S1-19]|nr:hypothetical protein [Aquitalea sp. S1-19]
MKARSKLWLILGVCVAPVLASTLTYFAAPPDGGKSYGTLLATQTLAVSRQALWPKGKWVLLNAARAPCDAECTRQRFNLGQIQLAQGEAGERLVSLTLFDAFSPVDTSQVTTLIGREPALLPGLTLVDPLGNQVLNYPPGAEPTRIIREVAKIMKTNNGLG